MIEFKTTLTHPYALKKGIDIPLFVDDDSNIVCPLFFHGIDEGEGSLMSFQRISSCGKIKKFDFGKPTSGGYWLLNEPPTEGFFVLVAEGLATAVALQKHANLPVAVAYGCHNMDKVAQDIASYWSCQPILCPDVGSFFDTSFPCLPSPSGKKNFDWCDYYKREGEDATYSPIDKRLSGFRGWAIPVICL